MAANPMKKTMSQKILSRAAGKPVVPGDIVVPLVDIAMANDGSCPMAIDFFEQNVGASVAFPERIVFIEDHYVPCPNERVAKLLKKMRDFAFKHKIDYFGPGNGVCHRLMPESGYVLPGSLVVGADSHTTTYGAINVFSTGIGSSDFAGVLQTGKIWLKVPQAISVELKGVLPSGTTPKDIALHIIGYFGAHGGAYRAFEFKGSGLSSVSIEGRFTICNMMVETGAKASIMPFDDQTCHWIKTQPKLQKIDCSWATAADFGASYEVETVIDLDKLEPVVAAPHCVANVLPVAALVHEKIHMGVIGTCTNGSIEDLRVVARILENNDIAPGVLLLIVPPSRRILAHANKEGLLGLFLNKGAMVLPPSCGPCCGALNGVPLDGQNVISTANRNFKGRMGNVNAQIFLASPATVAASTVTGYITDPRRFLNG
jgi:3-isopropylmalate/(R)-2-methylmalate dehydratase large subunit